VKSRAGADTLSHGLKALSDQSAVRCWSYVVLVTCQSFLLTYGANLAGYGVVVPIAMHATFNTVSRFLNGLFASTQPHARIPFELVMALSGLAVVVVLIVATRGQLAHRMDS
jgi:hypothetical protein